MSFSNLKYGVAFAAATMATQTGAASVVSQTQLEPNDSYSVLDSQRNNIFSSNPLVATGLHYRDILGFEGIDIFQDFTKSILTNTYTQSFPNPPSQKKIAAYEAAIQHAEERRAAEMAENFAVDYDAENGTGVVHFDTDMQSQTAVRSEHVAGNVFITETKGFEPTATIHMALDTQRFTLTQVEADPKGQFSIGNDVHPDQIDISENANVKILTAADTLNSDTPRAQEAHFAIGFPPQGDEEVLLTVFDKQTGNPIKQIDMSKFIDTNAKDHLVLVIKEEGHQEVLQQVMGHLLSGNQFQIEAQSQLGRKVVTHMFNAGDTLTTDLNIAGQALEDRNHSFTYDLVKDVQHTITYDVAVEPLDGEYFKTCEFIDVPSHLEDDEVTYWPAHTIATSGIMPRSPDQAVVATLTDDPSIVLAAGVIGYVGVSQQYGYGFDRAPNALEATYSNHGETGFYMQDSMPVGGCTGVHTNRMQSAVPVPVRPGNEGYYVTSGTTTQVISGVTHTIPGTGGGIITVGTGGGTNNPGTDGTPPNTGGGVDFVTPIGELEQHIVDFAADIDRATGGFTNFKKPVYEFLDKPGVNINGSFVFQASWMLAMVGAGALVGNRRRKTAAAADEQKTRAPGITPA